MAAFALKYGQQQVNDIIEYDTTGTKLYEKTTAALEHVYDHKEGHTLTSSLEVKERVEEMG